MTLETELTYPVNWTDVPKTGITKKISATKQECEVLAKKLGVVSFSRVDASFMITRWRGSGLKVATDIEADVVQACVVSLEKISTSLNEQAEWVFKPHSRPRKDDDKDLILTIDPLGEDPADPLIDGKVDLGVLLAEHLCLMIDPFIRSASVQFDTLYKDMQKSPMTEAADVSPFDKLKQLQNKQN